ncbi:receptor-like protein Cf-9 homolog [Gossypium hirsutum]|uniref:Receptor-like protein Cf-9 homolog n=1 Tax=Gossypium hirsutum TaxID=3635 RepID=A0A1U8LX24_GOSHI|nr:receptor-like protein Cf-9 homolog [Gossypium hirsutum]
MVTSAAAWGLTSTGTLPSWLYTAPSLKEISLSQNQFSGHIKEFQSKSLEYLYLDNNKLSEFPQFLKGLKSLESLDLSCNKIEGKIPQWMQEVGNDSLTYLNVSHNSLTEVEHFPWKNIEVLDLSSNLISGNLPILPSTINVFLISNNSFNGEVSSLICNATNLQILDLSHNYLGGTIPQCFGNLSNSLLVLNLKKNKFYGKIPPTFAKGCQLTNFNLNGNFLEGPLTPSILNCRGLEVLDLGNNKINDTFPHWLGSLPFLQVLFLKSNHMHGSLRVNSSKSSPFFSKIQIFDLSSNYFSGPLPVRYINSFKGIINLEKIGSKLSYMGVYDSKGSDFYTYSIGIVMKGQYMELVKIFTMWMIIDLSNNQFEGGIPEVFGKLNLLKGLNLSHNNLNGGIPTSIGNLTSLEWLDLSSNRLSGTIPNGLADLQYLSSFNVSENQLHGQIPQGKQFNTFGNDSYEVNKGLCGFPVSKGCNIIEPAPPNVLETDGSKSNIDFGWKVVLIGYRCGVVFGMSVGYVVFQTGKPKWLVNLVENQQEKRRRRKSKKDRFAYGEGLHWYVSVFIIVPIPLPFIAFRAICNGSHSCSSQIQFKDSFFITEYASSYCNEIAGLQSCPKTNSWKEGTDCCSWDGVTCDHLNAHVIALDLSCSWLSGNFPPNTTLFLLPHLQKLNLAYNDFNLSKIPSDLGRFTSLFYLNLSNTGFAGEVPSQVSHLSKLVSLDLSCWADAQTIDKHALEGLVHNLTEVRHLFLDGMDMSSVNAHVFMNLSSSLRSLSLAFCDFVESWTAMQHGARSLLLSRPAAIELSSFCLVRTNGF